MNAILTASIGVKTAAMAVFKEHRQRLIESLRWFLEEEYRGYAGDALDFQIIVPETDGLGLSGRVSAMVKVVAIAPTYASALVAHIVKVKTELWAMDQQSLPIVEPIVVVGGVALTQAEVKEFVEANRECLGIGQRESPRIEGDELIKMVDALFEQAKDDLLNSVSDRLLGCGESSGDLPCLRHVVKAGLRFLPMVLPKPMWAGSLNPVGELVLVPTFAGVHDVDELPSCKGGRPKYEPMIEEAVRGLLPVPTRIQVGQYEGVIATLEYHDARFDEYTKWRKSVVHDPTPPERPKDLRCPYTRVPGVGEDDD